MVVVEDCFAYDDLVTTANNYVVVFVVVVVVMEDSFAYGDLVTTSSACMVAVVVVVDVVVAVAYDYS